tara:strand:- start:42 stop:1325 length:1284 start_codon:yes stop_codon:yes gene_type:complete
MIYKTFFVFLSLFLISNTNASEIRNINQYKIFSQASYNINDTNLIDDENAENLLDNVKNLNDALTEKQKDIQNNNKNRSQPKYKGAGDIFEIFSKSVVYIGNRKNNRINGVGSGFIISQKGKLKIITNWHVIDGADSLSVWVQPDKEVDENFLISKVDSYSAKLIKVNKTKDLAMLEVEELPIKIEPVTYGKFSKKLIGKNAYAIGHPKGHLWTFTQGMISQVRPNYKWPYKGSRHQADVIQIQVPINPGNSGGPLFNENKELIGVNTFTSDGENLNFAIAISDVVKFINEKPKPLKKKKNKYIQKKDKGNTWIKKKKKKSSEKGSIDLSNAKEVDLNKNGTIDTWLVDDNDNGIYEKAYHDQNEDGIIEVVGIDKNEDNNFEIILIDTNNNGNPDEAEIDDNEDGKTDVIAYDFNEDGEWDKFENV